MKNNYIPILTSSPRDIGIALFNITHKYVMFFYFIIRSYMETQCFSYGYLR